MITNDGHFFVYPQNKVRKYVSDSGPGALGTLPKSLKRNLEELGADVASGLLQKSVVLETAHNYNQKSDGLLRRQDAARRTHTMKYQLVIAVMEQKNK